VRDAVTNPITKAVTNPIITEEVTNPIMEVVTVTIIDISNKQRRLPVVKLDLEGVLTKI
jgi:hypothetical protein